VVGHVPSTCAMWTWSVPSVAGAGGEPTVRAVLTIAAWSTERGVSDGVMTSHQVSDGDLGAPLDIWDCGGSRRGGQECLHRCCVAGRGTSDHASISSLSAVPAHAESPPMVGSLPVAEDMPIACRMHNRAKQHTVMRTVGLTVSNVDCRELYSPHSTRVLPGPS
jgi:hypothetical protein